MRKIKNCIVLINFLFLCISGCTPPRQNLIHKKWHSDPDLLQILPSNMLDSIGHEIHLYWEFEDRPNLWESTAPGFESFHAYQKSLLLLFGKEKLDSIRQSRLRLSTQTQTDLSGDRGNAEMIRSGKVGQLRSIQCLEAHLLAYQLDRYPLFEHPTEFHGFFLRKGNTLKVYFSASDKPWPPKPAPAIPKIEADIQNGWKLFGHLHNHYNSEEEDYVGVLAPSLADAQYYKALRDRFGLEKAFITNLFNSVEIDSSEFDLFHSH